MNLTKEMTPGLILLLSGAALCFGAKRICCRREQSVNTVKLLGVFIAAAGAVLIFIL